MAILIIGKNGQLGWELNRTLTTLGELTAVDFPDIDMGYPQTLVELVDQIKPQTIVNAAAYTAVDEAEGERELARNINALALGVLAVAARCLGAVFVHFSPDYAFDGQKR